MKHKLVRAFQLVAGIVILQLATEWPAYPGEYWFMRNLCLLVGSFWIGYYASATVSDIERWR